ncbi:MAG: twitch domain-containing radical SAM protein [Elusimicrobiota bacterium]
MKETGGGNPEDGPGKFCALAWLHRFTNVKGQIQVCCTSEEWDNDIRRRDGSPMNIGEGRSDEEILNSAFMKNVRLQMLSGRWPDFCRRCLVTEQTGGTSRRRQENEHFRGEIPGLLAGTEVDGGIPVRVLSADYRLGNLCNLACRMCNPNSSSTWARTWLPGEPGVRPAPPGHGARRDPYDWYRNPVFLERFKEQAPSLKHLHFAGGEPLIVPEMLALLRRCVEDGVAGNIELTYNTNITKIPAELKTLWPRFRAVRLFCSVDAFGALNEYIRPPSSWKTIDRNLRDLDSHFVSYGLAEVLIMTTVQAYNVLRLDELYDYLFENMSHVGQLPHLIDLHHPRHYRSQVLPTPLKNRARAKLEGLMDRTRARIASGGIRSECAKTLETLRSSINFLDLEDRQAEIPELLRAVRSKDALSGQDFRRVLPELAALSDSQSDE